MISLAELISKKRHYERKLSGCFQRTSTQSALANCPLSWTRHNRQSKLGVHKKIPCTGYANANTRPRPEHSERSASNGAASRPALVRGRCCISSEVFIWTMTIQNLYATKLHTTSFWRMDQSIS
jgi:hypothetical protein